MQKKVSFIVSVDAAKEIIIYKAQIVLLHIFLCISNTLKIVKLVILNLLDVFSSIDFETIMWTQTGNNNFKADPVVNNCGYCLTLYKLQAWKNAIKCQPIIQLKNCIYLLAFLAFCGTSLCYNYFKLLCHCLNIKFYQDKNILKARIKRVWEKKKELINFFSIMKGRKYFNESTLLFWLYLIFGFIEIDRYLNLL